MAQENPNRLAEWVALCRNQVPVARRHVAEWIEAAREDPHLIWDTPAVRYATYGLSAVILVWIALAVAHSIAPPLPAETQPMAASADFHVVCTNPACAWHFAIHREFGFRDFPVVCPNCNKKTGARAARCNSPQCRGRWVAPVRAGDMLRCPYCGNRVD